MQQIEGDDVKEEQEEESNNNNKLTYIALFPPRIKKHITHTLPYSEDMGCNIIILCITSKYLRRSISHVMGHRVSDTRGNETERMVTKKKKRLVPGTLRS